MAKILIVDDDRDIRSIAELAIASEGHEVVTAEAGEESLEMIRTRPPDLVVLDIMMPNCSGWDVLREIRSEGRTKHLPVIILSALGETSSKIKGLRAGADDYLVKPFDPEELVARIEALLLRRKDQSAGLQGRLDEHSLSEISQGLEQSSRTGTLRVDGEGAEGLIEFDKGRVVAARFGHLQGRDSFLAMLRIDQGTFRFEAHSTSPDEQREGFPVASMLMEAAWLEDELRKLERYLPPGDIPLGRVSGSVPEIPPRLGSLPFHEIYEALKPAVSMFVSDVVRSVPSAPDRVRLALAWLASEGHLELLTEAAPQPGKREDSLDDLLERLTEKCSREAAKPVDPGILVFHSCEEQRLARLVQSFVESTGAEPGARIETGGQSLVVRGTGSSLSVISRGLERVAEAGDAQWLAVAVLLCRPSVTEKKMAALLSTVEWTVCSRSKLYLVLSEGVSLELSRVAQRDGSPWRIDTTETFSLTRVVREALE